MTDPATLPPIDLPAAALVVANPLPALMEVFSAESVGQARALALSASKLNPTTAEELVAANAEWDKVDKLAKGMAEARLVMTRPVDALLAAIREREREATAPLLAVKTSLGRKLLLCRENLERLRQEAIRKAREAAEEVARLERLRIAEEQRAADAKAAEERKAAEDKRAAEAAMFGEEATPPVPEPARIIAHQETIIVPVVERRAEFAPIPKGGPRIAKRLRLDITDRALIPDSLAEVPLWVVDEKAVEKLLRAGIAVAGARMVDA